MKELTVALLMWISSSTSLVYDGAHVPEIVRLPQDKLVHVLYQGEVPRGLDIDSVSVAGLYNFRDGNIYLLESEDLETVEGRAVLVHELVHYLQYHSGVDRSVECIRKLEPAAYAAQAKYLAQHGKAPEFDQLRILVVSNCGWR